MAIRGVEAVLLCEDGAQVSLASKYLRRLGFRPHDVRIRPIAGGRGAGEQFVRQQDPREVQEHRRRAKKERTTLLMVFTDADTLSVAERFNRVIGDTDEPTHQEMIVVLISKRNVETWFECLLAGIADEETDYKGKHYSTENAAETLWQCSRPNRPIPTGFVPSLARAISELRRVEALRR